jgi:hypothetical protein
MGFFSKIIGNMKNVGKVGDTVKKKPKRKPTRSRGRHATGGLVTYKDISKMK